MNEESGEVISPVSTKKPWLWTAVISIVVIFVAGGTFLLFAKGNQNNLTDQKETFEKKPPLDENGNPIGGAAVADGKNKNQYNWSTMDQGPYRDKVSFATGTSLTDWIDSGKILAEHASVPDVVVKDGVLYVYFVDVSTDGIKEQVRLIKSSDNGKTWSAKELITIKGLGDKIAVDPSPFLLDDGQIRLYYFDISTTKTTGMENNTIYSAISSDGLNFTEEEGYRLRYRGIFDPDVIRVGDTWRMYVGNEDGSKVYSATSSDGMNFSYEGVAITGGAIPNVIYEAGKYYLYYASDGVTIATSTDGKIFAKTANKFQRNGLTADPGVVKVSDNLYFMVYKTSDKRPIN